VLVVRERKDPVVLRNSRTEEEAVVVVHVSKRLGDCQEGEEAEVLRSDFREVVEDEDVHEAVVVVEEEGVHNRSTMDTSCCNSHLEVRWEDTERLLPCTFLLFAH